MRFIYLKNFLSFCTLILILLPNLSMAQGTSAEFITDVKPAKLKSGEQARDGIKNVFFNDQKLYITNVWSGLQILDVSDVKNPREVGVYSTENRSQNCYVVDNTAYLSSELLGVIILDVSNPASIREIGRIKTKGDANFVVVEGYFAYVAEETAGISIYDIGNPATPMYKGGYDTPGWAWGLFLDGKTLYVADKSGGMVILDVSNPASPKKLGQYSQMRYAKTIQVENGIAYVSNGADGLWIFDVKSPAFPKLLSKINVDGYVYHTFKAGNSAFLANETKRRMDIINISDPSKPVKDGEYGTDSKVFASWKNNVNVFIAADSKTIVVRHNHPPTITQLSDFTSNENEELIFSVEGFDSDGDAIIFTIENMPQNASFDIVSGVFTWTPTYDESGIYPKVKITVIEDTDSKLSQSTIFDITINHVNRPPSLPDVADASIAENSKISFTIEEGSDPDIEDKGKLKYRAENLPEGASFSEKFRLFSWTPTFEQSGIYTIDFIIEDPDGLLMRDGSNITVTHVDRKPTLAAVDNKSVNENDLLTFTLDGKDEDKEDQQLLSYRAENLPQGAVFDANTATFSWTPTYDQSAKYSEVLFIFQAGNLSDSASVDLTVNHVNRAPTLNAIAEQTINESDTLKFSIFGDDPDIEDKGKLSYTASNLPAGALFDGASQTFTWVPTFEQSGSFKDIAFTISDPSGLNDTKTTSIKVDQVNRSPELQDIAAKTIDENLLVTFDLVGSDPDAEDQNKLVYSATGLPEGSKLEGVTFSWTPSYVQSGSYSVDFTISDGILSQSKKASIIVNHVNRKPILSDVSEQTVSENQALSFTITGSDPDNEDAGKLVLSAKDLPQGASFDALTGIFSWTPTFDQSGEYNVSFIITDPQGLADEKKVKVTVSHVNRTPEFAIQENKTVDENLPLSFTLKPATDPDVQDTGKLQYSAADVPAGAVFDAATQTFQWTPAFDQSGTYVVKFTVKDSEFSVDQPVTIIVNHVNRAPILEALSGQSVNENSELTVKIIASDPDTEDAGKVTVTVENLPEGAIFDKTNTTITWTPTYKEAGIYTGVSVTATDQAGLNTKATFDITVNNVNLVPEIAPIAPQTVDETNPITVTLKGSDPDIEDDGKLVLSVTNLPQGAVFDAASGVLNWTPTFDQAGVYAANAIVTDAEGLSAQTEIKLTVNNINRAPEISQISAQAVDENAALSVSIIVSDPDKEDQGNLKLNAQNLPQGATLNQSSKTLEWTPGFDQSGSYTVDVSVTDIEGLTAQTSFEITVNDINRAPEIAGPTSAEVEVGATLNLSYSGSDPDGDTNITYSVSGAPSGLEIDNDGNLAWTPNDTQAGNYTITIKASDGKAETTMSLVVTATAKLPPAPPAVNDGGN